MSDNIKDVVSGKEDLYNKPIQTQPRPGLNIGIDTNNQLLDNIVKAGISSQLDTCALESFTQVSQRRDQVYSLIESMCQDSLVASILETYSEDATERNSEGKVVWAESSDPNISKMVNFILDSCRVDTHVYGWVSSLCKYGDLYLRLYRQSDYDDAAEIFDSNKHLEEGVKVQAYKNSDHYVHYLEAEDNPAEMFDLTKFGKTQGYIKADISTSYNKQTPMGIESFFKFKKNDVVIYGPTEYVHGCLEDNSGRVPERVDLFLDSQDINKDKSDYSYKVRRGQSLFYDAYKSWRELSLLENSLVLNRVTKSAVTRMINVEVGDMPKEMVGPHLQGIKQLLEQKIAYNQDNSINEYNNPGPVENNVYIPTHGGIGALSATTIGGDVNVGQLPDVDIFRRKFFGSLGVPGQFFGFTDDNAGFSGGESLSIISSRYAKKIKRIQGVIIQILTDAVNLMLLDKKLNSYVGKFELHMMPPTTKEEVSRKEYISNSVRLVSDIMSMLSDISDASIKLQILKSLLSNVITDTEVITLIQEQIEMLQKEQAQTVEENNDIEPEEHEASKFSDDEPLDLGYGLGLSEPKHDDDVISEPPMDDQQIENVQSLDDRLLQQETILPSPEEVGAGDMTDSMLF